MSRGPVTDDPRPSTSRSPTLRPALEAVLMVADQPLDEVALASAVGLPRRRGAERAGAASPRSTPSRAAASSCATSPAAGASTPARSTPRSSRRFVLDGQQARLTQAALETLAVVAYKQPVSRARVSAIRGVNVDGVMRTLLTRGLVEEAGQDERDAAPTSTAPPATSWSGSGSPRSTTCPSWRRTCPTWTTSRTSWPSVAGRRAADPVGPSRTEPAATEPARRRPPDATPDEPDERRRPRSSPTDEDGLIRLQKLLAQSGRRLAAASARS